MIFIQWNKIKSRRNLLLSIAIANLASLTTGMMMTWLSPILEKLSKSDDNNPLGNAITSAQSSWIASFHQISGIVGPFAYAYLRNRIGRKYTMLLTVVPYIIAYPMAAFASEVEMFYIARFLAGFGIGGVFSVIPTYIAEVSDVAIRGVLCSTFSVCLCFGMLLSYVFGAYLSVTYFNMLELVVPVLMVALFYLLPETPYCLIEKDRRDTAQQTLVYLRGTTEVQIELKQIEVQVEEYTKNKGTFCDIFKTKKLTRAFLIAVLLVSICQFCGIDVVTSFTQNIFESAGVSMDPALPPIVIGAVQIVASLITPIAIDRAGRKALLIISAVCVIIPEIFLGLFFHLQEQGYDVTNLSWMPITTLTAYVIAYNLGLGPVPWIVSFPLWPEFLPVWANIPLKVVIEAVC
ncbi:hypothetical protein Trydic_g17980 [Trypoxylus dichotomus]